MNDGWACGACTFFNAAGVSRCEMCDTPGSGGGKGGSSSSGGGSRGVNSRTNEWFTRITGCPEAEWRASKKDNIVERRDGNLEITNVKTGEKWNAGRFYEVKLGDVADALPAHCKSGQVPFHIITRKDEDSKPFVDVARLQTLEENRGALFQVASNFNGVEAASEASSPDSPTFTEKYIWDPTQGPAASISAGPAAITRVHAAFHSSDTSPSSWAQTSRKQINFLSELSGYFPMRNGYVILPRDASQELPFPDDPAEREALLKQTKVGYHQDVQVTTGGNDGYYYQKQEDPSQIIDQVFCAALNIRQGSSGVTNSESLYAIPKAEFILDSAYQGTYLSAIRNNKKHIFLTLIGGGAFGNPKEWIYNAIVKAHAKWANNAGSCIEQVTLVLFSQKDIYEGFPSLLKEHGIPYKWTEYVSGRPQIKDAWSPGS